MAIRIHRKLQTAAWTLGFLIAGDLGLSLATQWLAQAKGPSHPVVRYFEYGRSTEGKLLAVARDDKHPDNAVFHAGWLDPEEWRHLPTTPEKTSGQLVAVYGQSFAFRVARQTKALDPDLTLRMIGGPAAPLNHSYAAYRLDQPLRQAQINVVGVLASALCNLDAVSGLSVSFEVPAPYTFPAFRLQGTTLAETPPVLRTEAEFRRALLEQGAKWQAFEAQAAKHDPTYDAFKFQSNALDESTLIRLARRGWVAGKVNNLKDTGEHGQAVPACIEAHAPAAIALLKLWHQQAQAANERLIVVLIQDKGFAESLTRTLRRQLESSGLTVVDSSEAVDSRNPRSFVADGHFTAASDARLAAQLLQVIRPE